MRELVIGTRGSALAMWQAEWVAARLRALKPDLPLRIDRITTKGDVANKAPLWQIGGGGLFVKEIERALLDRRVDLAVHSMKDLPSAMEPGLVVAAVPEREDPRDVLVSRHRLPLASLPPNARVGTSSSRRRAQLLAHRGDLQIIPLRGNLDTRLRKAESEDLDAVVLAAAGIDRLGYRGRITEYLPVEVCLPAIGQGALALQTRADDPETIEIVAALEHRPTRVATEAERALMAALGGGCQVPMAALCREENSQLVMDALVASPDGSRVVRGRASGDPSSPAELGHRLAKELIARGAAEILAEVAR